MTIQSFYRSIMTVEYQIHLPEYLAKCINKDLPQLHCNGQCVLMKKIEAKEKEETKKNLVVYESSVHYVQNDYPTFHFFIPKDDVCKNTFSTYQIAYAYKHNTSVFRPPIS